MQRGRAALWVAGDGEAPFADGDLVDDLSWRRKTGRSRLSGRRGMGTEPGLKDAYWQSGGAVIRE